MIKLQKEVKKHLDYDPLTGNFKWKLPNPKRIVGSIAGSIDKDGYIAIRFQYKLWRAHRLAFLYMTGKIPKYIDHIDMNKSNNKWSNLREATNSQNKANSKKLKNNTSGYKGVVLDKRQKTGKKWSARIQVNHKIIIIGFFDNKKDAAKAYNEAAIKYFGEFARLNANL